MQLFLERLGGRQVGNMASRSKISDLTSVLKVKTKPLAVLACIWGGAGVSWITGGLTFLVFLLFPLPDKMWFLSAVHTLFNFVLSVLVLSVSLVDLHWKGQVLTHLQSFWLCLRTLPWGELSIYILWFIVV